MVKQTALFPRAKAGAIDGHRNRGMAFEHALGEMHEIYRAMNIGRIEKNYCPTQIVKDGQWAKVIGRSTVDYVGVLNGGRMVAFDAKDCREDKIELSRLQEHQRLYLDDVMVLGGLAFVLVRFGCGDVMQIPIRAWDYALAARCAPETADTMEIDGWKPSGKAHIKRAELPDKWMVEGYDWARRCDDAEQQRRE